MDVIVTDLSVCLILVRALVMMDLIAEKVAVVITAIVFLVLL